MLPPFGRKQQTLQLLAQAVVSARAFRSVVHVRERSIIAISSSFQQEI
jgi:hypothetical protein